MQFVERVGDEYGMIFTRKELECIVIALGGYSPDYGLRDEYLEHAEGLFKNYDPQSYDYSCYHELADLLDET